jgi:DnaJ-domain-containing protein 1
MNSSATAQWISRLCEDVQDGRFSANLSEEEFNDVLKWLLEREFTTGQSISQSMLRFFDSEDKARQNTFLALDDYLFVFSNDSSYAKLGLSARDELSAVKIRYRRLIQLYHPDKGLAEAAGLSDRAEKINLAYNRIKSGQSVGEITGPPTYHHQAPRPPVAPRPSQNNKVYRSKPSDKLRWMLGTPEKMAYTLLSVLALVAVGILFTVYINNKPIEYPQIGGQSETQNNSEDTAAKQAVADKRFTSIADLGGDLNTPAAVVKEDLPIAKLDVTKTENREIDEAPDEKLIAVEQTRTSEPPPKVVAMPVKIEKVPVQVAAAEEEAAVENQTKYEAFSEKLIAAEKLKASELPPEEASSRLTQSVEPEPEQIVVAKQEAPKTKTVVTKTENQGIEKKLSETPVVAKQPEPEPTTRVVVTAPVQVAIATEKTPVAKVETKIAEDQTISEPPSEPPTEMPVVAKQVNTSIPLRPTSSPKHITKLSKSDQQQSIEVLVGYVDGMIAGDVNKSLDYVNETVLVNGEETPKDELREAYSNWLNESTQREYKVKVSNVSVHNGLVRISGKTNIKFKYAEKEPVKFKGVRHFDIQLDAFVGGKIVAISNG